MRNKAFDCIVCGAWLSPYTTVQFLPDHFACAKHSKDELDEALKRIKETDKAKLVCVNCGWSFSKNCFNPYCKECSARRNKII